MNILVYKFRPIILSGGWLLLTNSMSPYISWGSCPMGATIVNDKIWFTTTLESMPDFLYIQEYLGYDDDRMMDLWTDIYRENTTSLARKGWYEPQQIIKTYNNGSIDVTVMAWLKYGESGLDYLDLKVFHGSELAYSDASRVSMKCNFDNDHIYISDSGVINIMVKPDAYTCYNLQSTDDGLTWNQYLVSTHAYKSSYFYMSIGGYDNYVFVYLDWLGDFYRSSNNGQTWTQLSDVVPPNKKTLAAAYGHSLVGLGTDLYLSFFYVDTTNITRLGIMKSIDVGVSFTYYEFLDFGQDYYDLNNSIIIKDEGYLYLALWIWDRVLSDYRFKFYRSTDGESWELLSTYKLPNRSSSPNHPSFLAKSGDLIIFTCYYLDVVYGPDEDNGVGLKVVMVSEDGGITWDYIYSPFTDWDDPESYILLEWSFTAGDVEIYRRDHILDFIGNWELIATLPATPNRFLDTIGYGNVPCDYYVHSVGDGNTPVQYIHGTPLYMGYLCDQVLLDGGKIFVAANLHSLQYREDDITACITNYYMVLLLLEDLTQHSAITITSTTLTSSGPYGNAFITLHPLVFAYVNGNVNPGLVYVYWYRDNLWQGGLTLTSEGTFTSMGVTEFLIANEDGTAIVSAATYRTYPAPKFSRIVVAKTSDYGQTWTDPIIVWEWLDPASANQVSSFDMYSNGIKYFFIALSSAMGNMLLVSDDCSTNSASIIANLSSYSALATEGNDVYIAVTEPSTLVPMIFKLLSSGLYVELVKLTAFFCIHVSPTYSSDLTIFAVGTTIWKSTDGGVTWTLQLTSSYQITSIDITSDFVSSKTAFCLDGGGVLRKTIDGKTWSTVSTGHTDYVDVMVSPNFSSDNTVFITFTSYNKHVYKSTDGGVTFNPCQTGIPIGSSPYKYIYSQDISKTFASDQTMFVAGYTSSSAMVYRTTDGGTNWTLKTTGLPVGYIRAIAMSPNYASDQTVFATVDYSGVYKSTDGGDNWTIVYSLNTAFASIQVSPNYAIDQMVYVLMQNYMHYSTDGGTTWKLGGLELNTYMNTLSIESTSPVFISSYGTPAGVFKGKNGMSFELVKKFTLARSPLALDVSGNYMNLACYSGGYLYVNHSNDTGLNFTEINLTAIVETTSLDLKWSNLRFSREGSTIVLGGRGFYLVDLMTNTSLPVYFLSEDNGASWAIVQMDYEYTHDGKLTDLLTGQIW